LTHTFADIESRSLGLVLPGLACNFYDLDAMTQGFQRSDLIIVAGRPSMGKTSFTLIIARNIAAIHKLPVAIFSLEMSKEQLVQRLLSSEVQIESGRLRAGRISQNEWEQLGHGISSLSQLQLFIDDTPNITITEMRSKARRLQAEQGGQLGLIMVDYLQLMEGSGSDNRVQELSKVTRGLKALAREVNAPVIALSQLSRGVESRTNKRPMMSDLRESGSIEQDADLIVMLYRDEYYNPDTPDRGIAEVIITKHRNGPTGTVKLLFEPQFTRFRNLASPNRT
jgi:replicative DNA helicase